VCSSKSGRIPAHRPPSGIGADGHLRVGDADRERVTLLLGEALALGYLTIAEFETRCGQVPIAVTGQDLQNLLGDLPVHRVGRMVPAGRMARRAAALRGVRIHLLCYLGAVFIMLAVWMATALIFNAWYFWPVWPILGGGIGVLGHALPVRLIFSAHRPRFI
jgi:Domain of unknown function (DUF1707)/2TM domain